MNEEFLYHIWKFRLFPPGALKTTEGEPLAVLHSGHRNHDAGPDFTQSKVKIGKTIWAGNVEIHVKSSDWKNHRHQHDRNYANIILHVVYEDDEPVFGDNNVRIPTLELKGFLDESLHKKYAGIKNHSGWIPCEKLIHQVDDFTVTSGLHRKVVERLEMKSADILNRLQLNKNDWEETLYQLTARNFGLKINTEPFDMLARTLPQKIIAKHKNSLLQIEALLFGQAGMLEGDFKEDYPQRLKVEYNFLRKKYGLQPVAGHLWKFLRLRPAGFPTVRIAQFAALLKNSSGLFSLVLLAKDVSELLKLFDVSASGYWREHYRFGEKSITREKHFGKQAAETLIINAVVPLLFIYGKQKGSAQYSDKAISLLEQLPPEKNAVIEKWAEIRYRALSAYESQALLFMKKEYCDRKKCLECHIGNKLLNNKV